MQTTEIVKLPLHCDSLNAYPLDESLLLYSKKTQNVYGFEKGSAALFLQIDELEYSDLDEAVGIINGLTDNDKVNK